MTISPAPPGSTSRRFFLGGAAVAALGVIAGLPQMLRAQTGAAPEPFSFDLLTEAMAARAAGDWVAPEQVGGFAAELDYDAYRLIRFRAERARNGGEGFSLHAFHPGWLFREPVRIHAVAEGMAVPLDFGAADFEYLNDLAARVPAGETLAGVAGFRLNYPLNDPAVSDELVAFLGASYFRALGQGNAYGLSARGLALNTASREPEEFPRFEAFWIERATGGTVTVHAALDSPSVTGAYRMVVRPGPETEMDITARLFFRREVAELGVAPLTSMFLFDGTAPGRFDDHRPQVHDSNGLMIARADGDVLWRPINNPVRLAGSYLAETSPRAFGLMQRGRDFARYEDPEARYHDRPSAVVEPSGDWGAGAVRLVEIPTDLEVHDNIVAYWVPETPVQGGEAREYAYRLRWGMIDPDPAGALGHVVQTRSGAGGVSGVPAVEGVRKFVVDFRGGPLAEMAEGVLAVADATGGTILTQTLERLAETGDWRLVLDVEAEEDVVELAAHLAAPDRKLTEIWLFQWVIA